MKTLFQAEAFRQMTFRKKVGYIYDYYRFHILAVIASVAAIISLINIWINYRAPLLQIVMMDTQFSEAQEYRGLEQFLVDCGYELYEGAVELDATLFFETSDSTNVNAYQYLTVLTVSGGQELIFGSEAGGMFADLASRGEFVDLRGVLSEELLEAYSGSLIYLDTEDGAYPCGIMLLNNPWLMENRYYENCCVGICVTADRMDVAVTFLEYILTWEG